ncbi:MAG: 3-deoxy-D-manno-octulosonic acid transferase, partial [Candidatus Scalindua sp.]
FGEVGELIKKKGLQLLRKSDLKGRKASESGNSHNKVAPVILLDTLGELGKIYSIADIVFVGGSLVKGIGGHNLLEPAAYKKPILFGPYVENWMHVAKGVEDAGGAIKVRNSDELKEKLIELFSDKAMPEKVGEAAYKVASENGGATERNMEIIEGLLLRNGSQFTGGRKS